MTREETQQRINRLRDENDFIRSSDILDMIDAAARLATEAERGRCLKAVDDNYDGHLDKCCKLTIKQIRESIEREPK